MRQLTNAFPTSLICDPFYIAMPPLPPSPPLIRIILPNSAFSPGLSKGGGGWGWI